MNNKLSYNLILIIITMKASLISLRFVALLFGLVVVSFGSFVIAGRARSRKLPLFHAADGKAEEPIISNHDDDDDDTHHLRELQGIGCSQAETIGCTCNYISSPEEGLVMVWYCPDLCGPGTYDRHWWRCVVRHYCWHEACLYSFLHYLLCRHAFKVETSRATADSNILPNWGRLWLNRAEWRDVAIGRKEPNVSMFSNGGHARTCAVQAQAVARWNAWGSSNSSTGSYAWYSTFLNSLKVLSSAS